MKFRVLSILVFAVSINGFGINIQNQELLPTFLKIQVLDIDQNPMEGVIVTIYDNEEDYYSKTNPLFETLTSNIQGVVVFKKLKPQAYYVHAVKAKKSNMAELVLTEKLLEGRINKVTTIISND